MRVFLVEDDATFANEISSYLARQGVAAISFQSLQELNNFLQRNHAKDDDIILLDLGLGEENGMQFLVGMHGDCQLPCIILTGNDNAMDRILALELGADDYIIKTSPPREVLARLHAVARRVYQKSEASPGGSAGGYWQLNAARRDLLSPDGDLVGLTSAEFELVSCLVASGTEPVTRDQLSQTVLRRPSRPDDRSLDNLVSRIRKKVETYGGESDFIKSVRQYGYVCTGQIRGNVQPPVKIPARYMRDEISTV